jgi:demethylmenaquinone methyltransferase/2-methoxy-6-polyprenyl-1,4-benzoquinol methylase
LLVLEITRPARARWARVPEAPTCGRRAAHRAGGGQARDTSQLWRYYWDTIEACIPPETVMAALREAGFVDVSRTVSLGIFSEYTARRP